MSLSNLSRLIPPGPVLFLCIGTDRSTGDSLGPLVGTQLAARGYNVLGTLKDPVHAMNLQDNINLVNEMYPGHFIVAIDACLGRSTRVGKISVREGPLKPGEGVGKELQPVGDISIIGIVNVSGGMGFMVLQSTRLSLVMDMAQEIVDAIVKVLPLEHEPFLKMMYRDLKLSYQARLVE